MAGAKKATLPRQRREEILAELDERGSARVTALAKRFGVAEETIRRDLDKLSNEGRLSRTHGGALNVRYQRFDLPSSVRRNTQATEKRRIAQQALGHIHENDVVAFDASTTALELVCILPDMPLTVVTYGIDAARLLADRPQIQVILTGGELDSQSVCLLGPIAEDSLRRFSINKAFFSSKGVNLERGYSEASLAHASIKRLLMQLATQSYMLVDHSKFGVSSVAFSGEIQDVDVVVTDEGTDANIVETLDQAGVETEVATADVPLSTEG